jgi:hypothetical protein
MRAVSAALGCLLLYIPHDIHAYVDGPVTDRDGGSALTCRECHFHEEDLAGAGSISISGLPPRYESGRVYTLTLHLLRPDMKRGGFQMSVRGDAGAPAGKLTSADENVKVVADPNSGVTFAQHSEDGAPFVDNGRAAWTIQWSAPIESSGVVFYAAGNASNGDDSALGDVILLFSRALEPNH